MNSNGRLVASHRKNKIVLKYSFSFRSIYFNGSWCNAQNLAVEMTLDRSFFYAVVDVGAHPVLYVIADRFALHNHRHFGSLAPGLKRDVNSGVRGSYDNDLLSKIWMGLVIIVQVPWEVPLQERLTGKEGRKSPARG